MLSTCEEAELEPQAAGSLFIQGKGSLEQNLLGGAGLPLDDGLGCLVVLVRHGAGEGRHSLAVTDVETDVRVGNEELNDDAVLVADGDVDGRPAFSILAGDEERSVRKKRWGPTAGQGQGQG